MSIYWVEQSLGNVPNHNQWLAQSELPHLQRLHFPKRRDEWRLGRWTAKSAVATVLRLPQDAGTLTEIAILAESSGAPRVYVDHEPASVSISLSHRDGVASCALAQSMTLLGCDLELIESRSDAFVVDYFTDDEQVNISQRRSEERDQFVTALWSAKESTLKALRLGLRADTRSVNIRLESQIPERAEQRDDKESDSLSARCRSARWRPFQATFQNGQVLHGWWSASANLVRTFASAQPANAPIFLEADAYSPCAP